MIYRTRSERLHRDLFTFLGTASRAYTHHFAASLQSVSQKTDSAKTSSLGPAAIIFHETRHTKILKSSKSVWNYFPLIIFRIRCSFDKFFAAKAESAEDVLRSKFAQLHLDIEAFSSLRYVGVQTIVPPTNFKDLRNAVIAELENTTVRSSRNARIVFLALKVRHSKSIKRIYYRTEMKGEKLVSKFFMKWKFETSLFLPYILYTCVQYKSINLQDFLVRITIIETNDYLVDGTYCLRNLCL